MSKRKVQDFLKPTSKVAGADSLYIRVRNPKTGRFVKASFANRKGYEIGLYRKSDQKQISSFEGGKIKPLKTARISPDDKKTIAFLYPKAKIYRTENKKVNIITTLPPEILARQSARPPDIMRLVYIQDGQRRSFIITAPKGWKSKFPESKRIKYFGKNWQKRTEGFIADFLKRAAKNYGARQLKILGVQPLWSELK